MSTYLTSFLFSPCRTRINQQRLKQAAYQAEADGGASNNSRAIQPSLHVRFALLLGDDTSVQYEELCWAKPWEKVHELAI